MLSKDRRDRDREGSRDRDRYGDRERERGRDRSRDRSRRHSSSNNGGDLRDRLTDKYKDSDSYRDQHCDLSSSGKKQLLSMFLEEKNPDKDFKGKENGDNGDIESLLETNRKQQKDLEKRLNSDTGKKKKKKRSKSRSKDRKPLVSKDTENRKRKLSPLKSEKGKEDESRPKKDKARSRSRDKDSKKKKKEKKSRNRTPSKERKRSPSKTSSGSRKSRIDSGISVSTNFSKDSLSISPRDDRVPSPVKEVKGENDSSPKIKKETTLSPNKSKDGEDLNDSNKTTYSSPSPQRKVVELPAENEVTDEAKDNVDSKNPYSIYEQKHGVKLESKVESKPPKEDKKKSRSRERRRSRSRDLRRTRSRDRGHRRSRERDLKDEIDDERRRRRREYYQDRDRYLGRRDHYHSRHSGRHSPPGGHRRRRSGSPRSGDPASWEDKVNSFLANTLNATAPAGSTSLVEITKSEILPTDFDPSKPPPGMILPDYAIPASELASDDTEVTAAAAPVAGQPIRMLTDVQTGQLIPQPGTTKLQTPVPVTPDTAAYVNPPPLTTLPPPDYQQTMDITISAQPQAPAVSLEEEIAALNAMNQEREKNKKEDNKPLTVKEKKKLEKSRKELWQYVSKKLLSDPVFCEKVKKKKAKGTEDLKEKAEKCAVRIGLKLEKSGFSETRLWLMLKDNEKGIVGFHDELSAAVINETIETDLDARKPKDRLDAELLKDGTVFKYIGQYIQANPTLGKHDTMPSSGDLQEILETVNTNSNSNSPEPPVTAEVESEWDLAIKSFAPFKTYLTAQRVPAEVVDAYILCLVLSAFTYADLERCVTNFQPPEPENPDEPPETVYGHLLNCLREISFEKYPRVITENIDGHTVSIVRFVLDHYSKPRSPSPPAESSSKTTSPVPPVSPSDDAVPTGGNTTSQLPRKKYVLVSVSVDTIPVESGLAVWQVRIFWKFFGLFIIPFCIDLPSHPRTAG